MRNSASVRKSARSELLCCFLALVFIILYTYLTIESYTNLLTGLGPLVWAPLSEVYGRKPAVLAPYFIAAIFSFGTATAKDLQTIMITRFFAGFFGSAPVTNTGGVLGDIWTAEERGAAIVGYAMAVVGGPILGPIVGGAVVQSYLGWRWTEYVCFGWRAVLAGRWMC